MANTRGIFSLNQVLTKQRFGEFVPSSDVFIGKSPESAVNFGLIFGGYGTGFPSGASSICKISYSDDSAITVPTATLAVGQWHQKGAGSNKTGYVIGGYSPSYGFSYLPFCQKYDYSSDTCSPTPSADMNLSAFPGFQAFGATSNNEKAYFGGGYYGGSYRSDFRTLAFSNDVISKAPGIALTQGAAGYFGSASNSTDAYFGGGHPGPFANMNKLPFGASTMVAVPTANLSAARYYVDAVGNETQGYWMGGVTGSSPWSSLTDKIVYSTDTASPSTNIATGNNKDGITQGSQTAGYRSGGQTQGSQTDKIDYSTDNITYTPSANISYAPGAVYHTGGCSARQNGNPATVTFADRSLANSQVLSGPNFGLGTKVSPFGQTEIEKIDFSVDTVAKMPGSNVVQGAYYAGECSDDAQMYTLGGYSPGGDRSTVERITYANTTAEIVTTGLPVPRWGGASAGNENAGYYIGGGSPGGTISSVDKLSISTLTTSSVPGTTWGSAGHYGSAASAGNPSMAYIAGGGGPITSEAYKLTYSTETLTKHPSGNLTYAVRYNMGFASPDSAIIAGGYAPSIPAFSSLLEKINFSTGTKSMIGQNFPLGGRSGSMATGNSSNGYLFRGSSPAGYDSTFACKTNFSTETTTIFASGSVATAPSGYSYGTTSSARANNRAQTPLVTPTLQFAPSGNLTGPVSSVANNGYILGGIAQPGYLYTNSIDKVDFNTETVQSTFATAPTGSLYGTASSSSTSGYRAGGYSPSGHLSSIDKVEYATTTVTTLSDQITGARSYGASAHNVTHGYHAGGNGHTIVDKITNSTDSCARQPTADLEEITYGMTGTGNSTDGYFAGGRLGGVCKSHMQKLEYSSDTTADTPSAHLPHPFGNAGSTANSSSTDGYFAGGLNDTVVTPINAFSYMQRLEYSSDSTTFIPGSNLPSPRSFIGAAGNSTHGYYMGGYEGWPGPPYVFYSTISKIEYSTGTMQDIPATLGAPKYGQPATGPVSCNLPGAPVVAFNGPVIC